LAEVEAIGALNWDRILFTETYAPRGGEVQVNEIRKSVGGSATNTASWLANQREVAFNGFVGDDTEVRNRVADAHEQVWYDAGKQRMETEDAVPEDEL